MQRSHGVKGGKYGSQYVSSRSTQQLQLHADFRAVLVCAYHVSSISNLYSSLCVPVVFVLCVCVCVCMCVFMCVSVYVHAFSVCTCSTRPVPCCGGGHLRVRVRVCV